MVNAKTAAIRIADRYVLAFSFYSPYAVSRIIPIILNGFNYNDKATRLKTKMQWKILILDVSYSMQVMRNVLEYPRQLCYYNLLEQRLTVFYKEIRCSTMVIRV